MRVWLIVFMLVMSAESSWAEESMAALAAQADWSCVRFQVIGVCRRNTPPYVGAKVRYWQPVLLVETTKRSGQSGIVELKALVASLAGQKPLEASCGAAGQTDTTALQMNEAHVFGFPLSDAFSLIVEAPCEGPPDLSGMVSYLSEQDEDEWRRARLEQNNPLSVMTAKTAPVCDRYGALFPGMCLGTWGPLYPRTGFVIQASAPVASAVSAFRAVDIAALKPQTPHRVVSPVLFWPDVRYDRMQMVSPVRKQCMSVGENSMFWERGTGARDGRYVWIYWRKKECCLF